MWPIVGAAGKLIVLDPGWWPLSVLSHLRIIAMAICAAVADFIIYRYLGGWGNMGEC